MRRKSIYITQHICGRALFSYKEVMGDMLLKIYNFIITNIREQNSCRNSILKIVILFELIVSFIISFFMDEIIIQILIILGALASMILTMKIYYMIPELKINTLITLRVIRKLCFNAIYCILFNFFIVIIINASFKIDGVSELISLSFLYNVVIIFFYFTIWLFGSEVVLSIPALNNRLHLNIRKISYRFYLFLSYVFYLLTNIILLMILKEFDEKIFSTCFFINMITFVLLSVYSLPFKRQENVKITFLNLNYSDIINNKIYINETDVKKLGDFRVMKIDIAELFPSNSENQTVTLVNHKFFMREAIESPIETDKTYIYFCVNKKIASYTSVLYLNLKYKEKDKIKFARCSLILNIATIDNEIICRHYTIESLSRIYVFFFRKEMENNKGLESFHYGRLFQRAYLYNKELNIDIEFDNKKFYDIRKFGLHDEGYGKGKTTLDILSLNNSGAYPIVISPWEENYDNDILYLIFDKVMRGTNKHFYWPNKSVFIFFISAVIALTTIMIGLFNFIFVEGNAGDFINELVMPRDLLKKVFEVIWKYEKVIIGFSSLILSVLCTFLFLPTIIIHTKNSTKVHQGFYLNKINRQLKYEKVILLIEDVDRLERDSIQNVFRIVSSINHVCIDINRIIGILALNTNEESIKNLGNDLESLRNKTIRKNIFTEYSSIDSMKLYFESYITFILEAYNYSISRNEMNFIITKLPWNIMNFRDTYDILSLIIDKNLTNKFSIINFVEVEMVEKLMKRHSK